MSLNSGERQVTSDISEIRADHVARYKWVADRIPPGQQIIDFACGIGYGTQLLAKAGNLVEGFDIDAETISYARANYTHPRAAYVVGDGNRPEPIISELKRDIAISFETIEHIEDPRPLLRALRCAPMLIASVPNEDVMPWRREDGSTTMFHFRHYTKREFAELLNECGWAVTEWHGQLGPESDVEPDVFGRTLIAVCERVEIPDRSTVPTERHVAILGLGPSLDMYVEQVKRAGGRSAFCDEVWAINALGDVFDCDLIFHMDDIRIQMLRAAARPASNIARMVDWLRHARCPVVTSRKHPDFPQLVEFPLEDVLNHLGHDYFNNTAAYAVAFAIHTGATVISCFGMDYSYDNVHQAEKGRACVEFWLGQAHARGIKINMPKTTTLMDACCPQAARLYGYDTLDIEFKMQEDGMVKLEFTERDKLPTADEVEKSYDHSAPIAEQHVTFKESPDAL